MNSVPLIEKKRRAADHFRGGRLAKARELLADVTETQPGDIEAWILLAQVSAQMGNPPEVERCCRRIISVLPASPDAYFHLGSALQLQGRHDEAAEAFRHVLRINPNHAPSYLQLGRTAHSAERYDEALECYQKALAIAPGLPEANALIACIHQRRGDAAAAIAGYRREVSLRPRDYWFHSDLVSAFNYSDEHDPAAVYAEHVRWGQTHTLHGSAVPTFSNAPDPDRRLRVGYVSPDLRRHSVAFFFEPLLANHDPEQVETYCYAEVSAPDDFTEKLKALSKHWVVTHGMSHQALVDRIRSDRIDILVDLVGHNVGHRLLAFAARSAPVQVTYLGYPNTTGLAAMDYRFTDAWADPPGSTERYYTEQLVRLPRGFLCYRPLADAPAVGPSPALTNGYVTFGSFNNYMKVTPRMIAAWADLLNAVPTARMLLKNPSFGDAGTQKRCREQFAGHGIGPDRLELRGPEMLQSGHLGIYGQVDVALDTFPYNGTTTTCEALWMGVPVVTMAGAVHASRVGASLLGQVGLDDFVTHTTDDYIRCAAHLAADMGALVNLRASLRERVAASPLCDSKGFAAAVEDAYRTLWRAWCERRN